MRYSLQNVQTIKWEENERRPVKKTKHLVNKQLCIPESWWWSHFDGDDGDCDDDNGDGDDDDNVDDDDDDDDNGDDAKFLSNKQLHVPESFRISCRLTKKKRKTTPVSWPKHAHDKIYKICSDDIDRQNILIEDILVLPKHADDGKIYSEDIDLAKY